RPTLPPAMRIIASGRERSTPILVRQPDSELGGQRSSGVKPVRFAIRAIIFGPISSLSWNAKTTSALLDLARVRWESDWRFNCHPIFNRAASTRRALADGQLLKR